MIRSTAFIILLLLGISSINARAAASIEQVTSEFEQRLEQSQQRFQRVSAQLQKARQPQLRELQKLESELIGLRQQLAGFTRDRDEQFVSVQGLQKRLGEWQQQSRYIDNLLLRYLGEEGDAASKAQFSQRLEALGRATEPHWQNTEVVALDGRMVSGRQLTVGPLGWFMDDQGQGYIVDIIDSPAVVVMEAPLSLADLNAMPVDISQNKAIRIAARQSSWWSKLERGGLWVYPIMMLGVLALLVVLYKLYGLSRLPRLQSDMAQKAVAGEQTEAGGWQQQLFELAQNHRHWPQEALADKLHHQLLQWKAQLDSKMVILTATAAVAPLLGLLGTVSGMIHTFEMMNLFGNQDQTMLAGGISEALVTTELGLLVAVPVLLIHVYINRRHQGYLAQLEADAILFGQLGGAGRTAL